MIISTAIKQKLLQYVQYGHYRIETPVEETNEHTTRLTDIYSQTQLPAVTVL